MVSCSCWERVPDNSKGLLLISLGALGGSLFGLNTEVVDSYGAFGIIALRCSAQLLVMLLGFLIVWGPRLFWSRVRGLRWVSWISSLLLASQSFGISVAMLMTSVSNAYFVINTSPAMCVLVDVFLLKEKVPVRTMAMVLMCLAGVSVIFAGAFEEGGSVGGCAVALLTPVSWAILWGIQRLDHKNKNTDDGDTSLALALFFGELYMAILGWIVSAATGQVADGFEQSENWYWDLAFFLYFGGIYQPVVITLLTIAPRYIPTAEVACVKITETIWGPLWIYLAEDQVPTTYGYIGGAIIFCGVLGNSVLALRAGPPKEAPSDDSNEDNPDEADPAAGGPEGGAAAPAAAEVGASGGDEASGGAEKVLSLPSRSSSRPSASE